MSTALRFADPTPPRPHHPLPPPPAVRVYQVDTDVAHLANPVMAVQRMLALDMGAFARVSGDEQRFTIEVVAPHDDAGELDAWIRWIVHHAGIRGTIRPLDGGTG